MSSMDTGRERGWRAGGSCGTAGWHPVEILAVVLGFMVYWPIGLGLLAWKLVQRRSAFTGSADWFGQWRTRFEGMSGAQGFGPGGWAGTSGNAAFDDWRKAEIERLEDERRKLEAARREFEDFAREARKARDREEFERFMRGRGGSPS